MPRKRWIPKEAAQTYRLYYRPQDDPLINDDEAGDRALFQISGPSSSSQSRSASHPPKQGLHIEDLEHDVDLESMRENEGEAAQYGIYFDDTKYDYMQHLRDVGEDEGESYLADAISAKVKGKGKGKTMRLEDALREVSLNDEMESRYTGSVWDDGYSTLSTKNRTIERQQDIPDEIAGFQPDMDPRLREALEALEDDAYVDDKDDEDIFGELGLDGKNGEVSLEEFEMTLADDDEGWESDATEKAPSQPKLVPLPQLDLSTPQPSIPDAEEASAADGDWLRDFAKFKREQANSNRKQPAPAAESIFAASALNDKAPTLYTLNGTPLRQKKRKGAQTNPSAYSMTSSSLARTEGQQSLDAHFDKFERMYSLNEDDELDDPELEGDGGMSLVSGMTGQSKMSKLSQLSTSSFADKGAVRGDFDSMMDGFLGDWDKANPGGKRRGAKGKRGKNGNEKAGLDQLEEVRKELGRGQVRSGMGVS